MQGESIEIISISRVLMNLRIKVKQVMNDFLYPKLYE